MTGIMTLSSDEEEDEEEDDDDSSSVGSVSIILIWFSQLLPPEYLNDA